MREPDEPQAPADRDEGALRRWSRRKAQAQAAAVPANSEQPSTGAPEPVPETPDAPADAELPPLESLNEDSDYSAFLSPEVGEELRRLALRKLFHLPKFNVCDGLDDYDDDYRGFEALGEMLTADLRHRMGRAAEQAQAPLGQGADSVASETPATHGPEAAAPETIAETDEHPTPQPPPGAAPQGSSIAVPQGPDPEERPPKGSSRA